MTKFEALFTDDYQNVGYYVKRKETIGNYLLGRTLGEGTFAKVKKALHLPTGERVAVKIIKKKRGSQKKELKITNIVQNEVASHRKLYHSNIIQLYEALETTNHFYLAMELADGPTLNSLLKERGSLSEYEARRMFRQMVSAVDHLHQMGVVHRDLKLENILLNTDMNVKIIDFGLSGVLDGDRTLCTQCGSPAYTAPEIFAGQPYTSAVDIWSLGVNLFVLLTGRLPFPVESHSNLSQLHAAILRGTSFPSHLSHSCQDLLRRLLEVSDTERITMSELMAHQWVNQEFAPLLPWEPTSHLATSQQLDQNALNYMNKKLGISEAVVKDSVLRRKTNSVSATYHLLSRRYSKGLGCRNLSSTALLGRRPASRTRSEDAGTFDVCHESKEIDGTSDVSDGNNSSIVGTDLGTDLSTIDSRAVSSVSLNRSTTEEKRSGNSDFKTNENTCKFRRSRINSGGCKSHKESLTADHKGVITRTKPHSTTIITLPRCTNEKDSDKDIEEQYCENSQFKTINPKDVNDTTPRQTYKDCLHKLRLQRMKSPGKGILKTAAMETFPRPVSVTPDGNNTPDDLLSSAYTLPTDGCDLYKRESSASSKSVRFRLTQDQNVNIVPSHVETQRTVVNERMMTPKENNFERPLFRTRKADGRTNIQSRDAPRYTWASLTDQNSTQKSKSPKVPTPNRLSLNIEHHPTPAPPNSAHGYRWRRVQNPSSTESSCSSPVFQRESSILSSTPSKTRKQILDRYKLQIKNSDGDRSLVVNVTVVDNKLVSKTNPGDKPRTLGNIRGRTITLIRHNPTYKTPALPPATQTNVEPRCLTTSGSFEDISIMGEKSSAETPDQVMKLHETKSRSYDSHSEIPRNEFSSSSPGDQCYELQGAGRASHGRKSILRRK